MMTSGQFATTLLRSSALAALFALAACGGGGGGDGGGSGGAPPPPPPAPLAAGTFVKTYSPAVSASSMYPFTAAASAADVKHQTLYTASEVGGTGRISALHFRRNFSGLVLPPVTCPNVTVRLGHTSLPALTVTFASNIDRSSLVTALNNATVTIPGGGPADTWFEIPFTTPFGYNGVDNLVVEIEKTAACTAEVQAILFIAATNRRALSFAADSNPDTAQHNQITASAVDAQLLLAKFAFAGGDDPVTYPNSTGLANPFGGSSANRHVQMLHLASDLNGSGPITGIAMISTEAPTGAAGNTVNIRLGHTTLAALTSDFANNLNSGAPVTVASGLTFNVPAGVPAGTPIWLPLSGSFNYNGTDNLIVDIEVTALTSGTFWSQDDTIAGRRLYAAVGAATGTVAAGAYHTVFRFNGAPVQVMPLTNNASSQVLGSISPGGQIQNLYDSTSLGTGGRITNVAVRLSSGATPTATSLANYKVYMGHTAKTQYNAADTYASNMDENMLVFNGTLNIPAGLKQGDWVSIPLQTPFTYDPSKNLSILFTSDFSVAGNSVFAHLDATRFPVHAVGRNDNAVGTSGVPGWTANAAVNVQLQIEK